MNAAITPAKTRLLPVVVLVAVLVNLAGVVAAKGLSRIGVPSPPAVARGFVEEARSGRLVDDVVASLFRVTAGFALSVFSGIPVGLWLGHHAHARAAFLPVINFFRSLSPRSSATRSSALSSQSPRCSSRLVRGIRARSFSNGWTRAPVAVSPATWEAVGASWSTFSLRRT